MATFRKIRFGDNLDVTDEGDGVIRLDATGGGGSGGGIDFGTYPQTGNWFYLETNDSTGSPNDWGLQIFDNSGLSGGIYVESMWSIGLNAHGPLNLGGGTTANLGGASGVNITPANPLHISLNSQNELNWSVTTNLDIEVGTGFRVINGGSGAVLLEVRADGTLHIPTGATWIADLP